jgi:hypothetical protein
MGLLLRICRDRAERPQGAALSFVIGRSSSVHKSEFAGFEERANDAESEGTSVSILAAAPWEGR